MKIKICEVQGEKDFLTCYEQTIPLSQSQIRDFKRGDGVLISVGSDEAVLIPLSAWSEFVRHCQKLSTSK